MFSVYKQSRDEHTIASLLLKDRKRERETGRETDLR